MLLIRWDSGNKVMCISGELAEQIMAHHDAQKKDRDTAERKQTGSIQKVHKVTQTQIQTDERAGEV